MGLLLIRNFEHQLSSSSAYRGIYKHEPTVEPLIKNIIHDKIKDRRNENLACTMRPKKRVVQSVPSVSTDLKTTGKIVAQIILITAVSAFILSSPVAAQEDCTPDSPEDCDATTDGFEGMLNSLFDVVLLGLQYGGFIALVLGLVVWLSARRSSSRAQYGSWLLVGGVIMLVVKFGFDAVIQVLKYIAEGGL